SYWRFFFCFFFQAEDGIRDRTVTGVQTCALPISRTTRPDPRAPKAMGLRGKPIAFGARGSGLVVLARYVLDGLGLDQERDFQAVYLERAGDGPAMVLDGRVAALWGGGVGWPGFTAVASSGGRFIAPTPEE